MLRTGSSESGRQRAPRHGFAMRQVQFRLGRDCEAMRYSGAGLSSCKRMSRLARQSKTNSLLAADIPARPQLFDPWSAGSSTELSRSQHLEACRRDGAQPSAPEYSGRRHLRRLLVRQSDGKVRQSARSRFLDIEMNLKDHPKFLWAIVATSTACFVVSAVLLYLSRKQILDMVEKYYARSLEQVGLLSLRVPDPRARVATQIFMDHGSGA